MLLPSCCIRSHQKVEICILQMCAPMGVRNPTSMQYEEEQSDLLSWQGAIRYVASSNGITNTAWW